MSNTPPLAGIRVLDLSRILAGPITTQVLADLGADVVKVERPGAGDDTRQWGPPFLESDGPSAYFLSCNRGKRSLALDLASAEGRGTLDDLLRCADVMIENFLPEAMREFGLEPSRLKTLNPTLVSCSISAFGRRGPMADRPGYDLMIQAMSGLMSITGEAKGMPMKVGVAITDVLTGVYAATSVLAGLVAVGKGGGGRAFDVSLHDCTLSAMVNVAQSSLVTGERPKRFGNAHPNIVPYEVFATADGHLALAIGADRQWQKFCVAVEHDDWAADPRFTTNPSRVAHRNDVLQLLVPLLKKRSTAVWQEMLTAIDVPHSPVVPLDTALTATQVAGRDMVREVTDSAGRKFRILGSPIHWDDQPPTTPRAPPALGEHSDEVLRDWLGYSQQQVDELRFAGVIG